jgi:multicomponent Na+:H+ antiporter subunit C
VSATAPIRTALAVAPFGLGLGAPVPSARPLEKLIGANVGANVMGLGAFAPPILIARGPDGQTDPVPQALVVTGIVVTVAGTGLALLRRARSTPEERA